MGQIRDRFMNRFQKIVIESKQPPADVQVILTTILTQAIDIHERALQNQADAKFVGDGALDISESANAVIREIVEAHLAVATPEQKARLLELGRLAITKGALSSARTGVVIAGFGTAELFPTLISCEVDGMVCGRLKFVPTNYVDIDRKGPKAQVIPFAQKEMVERFLYGLDEDIQRQIGNFCKVTVPAIREKVLSQIDLEQEEDKAALVKDAEEAEAAFVKALMKRPSRKFEIGLALK